MMEREEKRCIMSILPTDIAVSSAGRMWITIKHWNIHCRPCWSDLLDLQGKKSAATTAIVTAGIKC